MQILYENQLQHQRYEQHSYATICRRSKYTTTCLQHVFINGNHWILALIQPNNIHYQAIIYDSKKPPNSLLPHDIYHKLQQLMPSLTFHYKYANVMQQPDNSSCGVFTLAYATDIAYQINPETSIYNVSNMRSHLRDCITQSKLIPFPKQNIH